MSVLPFVVRVMNGHIVRGALLDLAAVVFSSGIRNCANPFPSVHSEGFRRKSGRSSLAYSSVSAETAAFRSGNSQWFCVLVPRPSWQRSQSAVQNAERSCVVSSVARPATWLRKTSVFPVNWPLRPQFASESSCLCRDAAACPDAAAVFGLRRVSAKLFPACRASGIKEFRE
jgi:hypothetical protein